MGRWIPSPVGGYWTLRADTGDRTGEDTDELPPIRLQGDRPELALEADAWRDVATLPHGEACRFLLDGEPFDLTRCRVERLDVLGDGVISFLASDEDSPLEGRPARMHLDLSDPQELTASDEMIRAESFRSVDCLQHDGHGTLRLSVWGGLRQFPAVTFSASALRWRVEGLDPRRPPYVLLMAEHGTDGVWDLATGDADIKTVLELDDLDLPADLRERIRRWQYRWEHLNKHEPREAEAIATALRRCWPDAEVRVHD